MNADNGLATLRLFGPLRAAVGKSEVQVSCAGCSARDALVRFAEGQGDAVRPFIFDECGNQRLSLILLLNGEPIQDQQSARVESGDVLSLLFPLAGG
jgi:molybdopterin converting factor small subunit